MRDYFEVGPDEGGWCEVSSGDVKLLLPTLRSRELSKVLARARSRRHLSELIEGHSAAAAHIGLRELDTLLALAAAETGRARLEGVEVTYSLHSFAATHARAIAALSKSKPGQKLVDALRGLDDDGAALDQEPPSAPKADDVRHRGVERGSPHAVELVDVEQAEAQLAQAKSGKLSGDRDKNKAIAGFIEALLDNGVVRRAKVPLHGDLEHLLEHLADVAPHMRELADSVRAPLAVAQSTGVAPFFEPVLLVGPPGVGKTHAAQALAEVLGVQRFVTSYATPGAGCSLAGTDRHWSNAEPGLVAIALRDSAYGNPVLVLDEVDKAGKVDSSTRGQVHTTSELLPLLEPLTARAFEDRCLGLAFNAAHIVVVATANSLAGIPAPLLSRMRLVHVGRPSPRESMHLVDSVAAATLQRLGAGDLVRLPSGEVRRVLAGMTPRLMRRTIQTAVGFVVQRGAKSIEVQDIEEALGLRKPRTWQH